MDAMPVRSEKHLAFGYKLNIASPLIWICRVLIRAFTSQAVTSSRAMLHYDKACPTCIPGHYLGIGQ